MTSYQLPSDQTHEAFGEINVERTKTETRVELTILMEPEIEGVQTGIALDGSASMRGAFGRLKKTPPREVFDDLLRRGLMTEQIKDGHATYQPTAAAIEQLKLKGHWGSTDNVVEAQAREMTGYLANNVDEDGGTTVIYWACGDGRQVEVLGDLTAADCTKQTFTGPSEFGRGTYLVPAMRYFLERFAEANYGFYVFMTDGALDDLEEVKRYTTQLARDIAAGRRNRVKCVLIGVGQDVQREQMEALDDLDTGTEVDIWDHKIAHEMRSMMDIFAEVVDANAVIAPEGAIYDQHQKLVKAYKNGVPASLEFFLGPHANAFTLEVGSMRVTQKLP